MLVSTEPGSRYFKKFFPCIPRCKHARNQATKHAFRDVGLTYDGRSRGSGIVIATASGTGLSNIGKENVRSPFDGACASTSEARNCGQTSGNMSGRSTKQSSLRSLYSSPCSSKAHLAIDLAHSMAPSHPRWILCFVGIISLSFGKLCLSGSIPMTYLVGKLTTPIFWLQ